MKRIDVSPKVMNQVVGFEKRRSLFWMLRILAIVLFLGFVGIFFLALAVSEINELGSWELLGLFVEDFGEATKIWKDLILTFWNEIPQRMVLAGFVSLVLIAVLFILKRGQLRAVINRLNAIWKYKVPKV